MDSHVVVFPSEFARGRIALLAYNVKKILDIKRLSYDRVWRDGQLVIVDAADPVFASSAIGLLYGIERVAIARKVGSGFEETVKEMARVGSSLLLRGDRFYFKVGGTPAGATSGDLELAATSETIKISSASGALPGTAEDHNRLLYTHVTEKNSYVCIFLDSGLGGLPYRSHVGPVLCCIYDELSAIACLETVKQGFEVRIIVCHGGGANLRKLVKMVDRILPRLVSPGYSLEFFRFKKTPPVSDLPHVALAIAVKTAKKSRIDRVCIPSTPVAFAAETIDLWTKRAFEAGLIPYTPLGALEKELLANAKEAGLGRFSVPPKRQKSPDGMAVARQADAALAGGREIILERGVNGVHEMLDALEGKQG